MRRGDMKKKTWFFKTLLLTGLVILGLIIWAIIQETYKKRLVQKEIDGLKQEAQKIEKDNAELTDKIAYLESQNYQEKEAKDKLSLQKPDENVVIIKPNLAPKSVSESFSPTEEKKLIVRKTNMQKWWEYFFQYKD